MLYQRQGCSILPTALLLALSNLHGCAGVGRLLQGENQLQSHYHGPGAITQEPLHVAINWGMTVKNGFARDLFAASGESLVCTGQDENLHHSRLDKNENLDS